MKKEISLYVSRPMLWLHCKVGYDLTMIPLSYSKQRALWVSVFSFVSEGQILSGTRVVFQPSGGNISSSFSQVKQHVFKMSSWRSNLYSAHTTPQIWTKRMTAKEIIQKCSWWRFLPQKKILYGTDFQREITDPTLLSSVCSKNCFMVATCK